MLRRAAIQDLDKIIYVLEEVREDMKEIGIDEFDFDYPKEDHFREEIENGHLYLRGVGTDIAGFICISNNEILNSSHIKWSRNIPGTSFHRLVINKRYKDRGIEEELILLVENISIRHRLNYVKGVTYKPNADIIDALRKLDYRFVGDINVENKKYPFCCYEKLL